MKAITLVAAKDDPIPVHEMVEFVNKELNGGDNLTNYQGSNAKAKLKRAARELQRINREKAPPERIDDKAIDDWVERYARKTRKVTK